MSESDTLPPFMNNGVTFTEMWNELDAEERLAHILETFHAPEMWARDEILETLALFRHKKRRWLQITERYKAIRGSAAKLEQAVDEIAQPAPSWNAAPSVFTPTYDDILQAVHAEAASLGRALFRSMDTTEANHETFDHMLIAHCRAKNWHDSAIIHLIEKAYEHGRHTPPDIAHLKNLISASYLQGHPGEQSEGRARFLVYLSSQWGVEIVQVIRHGTEQSLWHIKLKDGQEVNLGSTKDLLNPNQVRVAIFDVTGIPLQDFGPKKMDRWYELCKIVYDIADVVDTPDLTRIGQIRALVLAYAQENFCTLTRDVDTHEWEQLAEANKPFIREGKLHLHARHFWVHHVRLMAPDIKHATLLDMLRLLGAVRDKVTLNTIKTSRSMWSIPVTLLQEESIEVAVSIMEKSTNPA